MVTRSSLVWVMTGIAAGIAGGWLWNRERTVEMTAVPAPASYTETIRSPFAPRREERASYLTHPQSDRSASSAAVESRRRESSSDFSHRRALYASASLADRTQLDAMIADAKALANANERRSTLDILLLRYAEIDADGALRYAADIDRETATHLIATLAAVIPDRAWEYAAHTSDPAERLAYLNSVITVWAADEPERVFTKVTELPAQWQRSELLQQAIGEIATRNPRLAMDLVGRLEPAVSTSLLDLVASVWSRNDPSAAARWVESNPRAKQSRLAYRVADAYIAQKPDEALAWGLRLATTPQRYLWSSMLGRMAAYNPDEALRLAQAAENPAQRAQALGNVLAAIAQTNPSLATAQLMKIPPGNARSNIIYQIADNVAATTPGSALDWLNSIDDARTRIEAATSLGNSLARRDVEAAAQLMDRIPKEARSSWISSVAMAYADSDVEKGRQWIKRYASEAGPATVQFARTVAARNPEAAVQMIEGVSDDKERDRLLSGMLPMLAENSPETAARWAERMSDENARASAVAQVTAVWAQYDAQAARKWVQSLDGGERDQGLTVLVERSGAPLDEMLPIINQIQVPERRMHAVLMTAMRLAQNDPESARTLLRRYPLDPARQRQFDDFMQRRGRGQ
jgi:hypothetical protein